MKGIFHWLGMNLSRRSASETRSAQLDTETDSSTNGDSRENVGDLMPDIYGEEKGDTVPMLEIIQEKSTETHRSRGVDPYNTGSFELSKE